MKMRMFKRTVDMFSLQNTVIIRNIKKIQNFELKLCNTSITNVRATKLD